MSGKQYGPYLDRVSTVTSIKTFENSAVTVPYCFPLIRKPLYWQASFNETGDLFPLFGLV